MNQVLDPETIKGLTPFPTITVRYETGPCFFTPYGILFPDPNHYVRPAYLGRLKSLVETSDIFEPLEKDQS